MHKSQWPAFTMRASIPEHVCYAAVRAFNCNRDRKMSRDEIGAFIGVTSSTASGHGEDRSRRRNECGQHAFSKKTSTRLPSHPHTHHHDHQPTPTTTDKAVTQTFSNRCPRLRFATRGREIFVRQENTGNTNLFFSQKTGLYKPVFFSHCPGTKPVCVRVFFCARPRVLTLAGTPV